jgi:dephospho-CoA kinase
MIIIGLTGGIGSGKTTVAKLFIELGVPVYFTDVEAKILMNNSEAIRNELVDQFGKDTFRNGELNREYLAKIIFNNKEQLSIINGIVHPKVKNHFKIWVKNQDAPFVIQESALIFENNKQNDFDKIITITAPLRIRIQRVMNRDNVTEEQVLDRIKNQIDDEFKVKNSSFIIHNIDLVNTKSQVKTIFDQLLLEF